jgi:hypothetical protein
LRLRRRVIDLAPQPIGAGAAAGKIHAEGHLLGPMVLGMRALILEDRDERKAALQEGAALLRTGAVSHNQLFFGRAAMEACLADADWGAADGFASDLDEYSSARRRRWRVRSSPPRSRSIC